MTESGVSVPAAAVDRRLLTVDDAVGGERAVVDHGSAEDPGTRLFVAARAESSRTPSRWSHRIEPFGRTGRSVHATDHGQPAPPGLRQPAGRDHRTRLFRRPRRWPLPGSARCGSCRRPTRPGPRPSPRPRSRLGAACKWRRMPVTRMTPLRPVRLVGRPTQGDRIEAAARPAERHLHGAGRPAFRERAQEHRVGPLAESHHLQSGVQLTFDLRPVVHGEQHPAPGEGGHRGVQTGELVGHLARHRLRASTGPAETPTCSSRGASTTTYVGPSVLIVVAAISDPRVGVQLVGRLRPSRPG